jgi:hypothetical protein
MPGPLGRILSAIGLGLWGGISSLILIYGDHIGQPIVMILGGLNIIIVLIAIVILGLIINKEDEKEQKKDPIENEDQNKY